MNLSNQPEEFPLSIAGLPITLKFWPIKDYPHEKRLFKRSLLKYMQNFKSPKHFSKHTTINIVDLENYQIVFNKTTSYAELAHYQSEHIIEMPYQISISQFFMTLSNLLASLLLQNNGIILHASACLIEDKVYIFMGPHGAGKSTIVRMLRERFSIVSDDLIYVKKLRNMYVAYQSPVIEKVSWIEKKNIAYPLGGLYILRQSETPYFRKLNDQDAMKNILSNMLLLPKKKEVFIATVFDLLSKKPMISELGFNQNVTSVIHTLETSFYHDEK